MYAKNVSSLERQQQEDFITQVVGTGNEFMPMYNGKKTSQSRGSRENS